MEEEKVQPIWYQVREADLRATLKPARELIDGLKKINCRIAISNYSDSETGDSLLKHLDIDMVKLSPEFMRDLASDQSQQDKMNTVNRKLQTAGYTTVASSVEDAGSLAILWNIGVNYIQGYFLQEPSSTITFEEDQ